MTWAQLVSKICQLKSGLPILQNHPTFLGCEASSCLAKLLFSLVTSGWSLQQESPFLVIFTLKIRWRREMAGFGPTGGWGPWRVGWVFLEKNLVAVALHHQNNGRNERHGYAKKIVRYRWYLHIVRTCTCMSGCTICTDVWFIYIYIYICIIVSFRSRKV